jgi:ADP-ribose pyrophosphatase
MWQYIYVQRLWECAERKTRKSSGVDGQFLNGLCFFFLEQRRACLAVAVFAIIRSKNKSFAPSTVLIEQYRPPIDKYIVGECIVPALLHGC